MSNTEYNGWSNYETWNVALWINNDENLYSMARRSYSYQNLVATLLHNGITETDDGVSYFDNNLDIDELEQMLEEL